MNKQEKIIVAILVLALFGSFYISNRDAKRLAEQRALQARLEVSEPAADPESSLAEQTVVPESEESPVLKEAVVEEKSQLPEGILTLSNEVVVVTLTSKGGGIKDATFPKYGSTGDPADGPLKLDFSDMPSMTLDGIAGLGKDADFELSILDDGRSAHIKAKAEGGLYFERLLFLTNGYNIAIIDSLRNSSDVAVSVPRHKIVLGPMELKDKNSSDLELAVSISSSQNGRQNVSEINSKTKRTGFTSQFGAAGGGCSAATVPLTSPLSVSSVREADVSWLAVRERFFVQVLTPASHSPAMESTAWRNPSAPGNALQIKRVSAALIEDETVLEPGASVSKEHSLFIGPRKMSELRKMGSEYTKIMSFGTWAFFCKMLLDLLNFLYSIIPNYGIAIILLTALVRLLLFPVNKRNAESMRKMAEVQPLIKEVQEKYKDDPKKLQAETMRIYGEKKINPLASCLPMFIQLPIFIALFTVLRSAVELRYASFLWISDLSAPENLFREHFGFGVNILPIAMALTMALQSSLTPTTGDRQQQRMMMVMMPVMMLLICYNFASALSLYWTVSQVLAIAGLLWSRRKRERDSGESEAVLVKETRQMRRDRLRRESR